MYDVDTIVNVCVAFKRKKEKEKERGREIGRRRRGGERE